MRTHRICSVNGITILEIYINKALSAKTDDRPQLQSMIKDSSKKKFNVIIAWKLYCFARNRHDLACCKKVLKKNNFMVFFAAEHMSDCSEYILLESVPEDMVKYYSTELSEKVTRVMTENTLKCRFKVSTDSIR